MPAKYVRPYSKDQKSDYRDAEAIAEAVQRPTMKFVTTKTADHERRLTPMLREDELIDADRHSTRAGAAIHRHPDCLGHGLRRAAAIALESTRHERKIRKLQMELAHANREKRRLGYASDEPVQATAAWQTPQTAPARS
jgi:transposase